MTIQVHQEVLISLNKNTKWPIAVEDDVVSVESDCLTLSTASLSDDAESIDCRVSFSEELVTDVWERPPTQIEEIPDLFYSKEETDRFRQEYRMERKLLSSFDSYEELDQPRSHNISRVVVLHNDKLETFSEKDQEVFFDTPEFWSGSITWW